MGLNQLPLFAQPTAQASAEPIELKPLSVTELTSQIKGVLEPTFREVWVQGEISNYRPAASGHIYFSLKDESSCIAAASFGWLKQKKNRFEIKDGQQVLCRGKISIYPPRGTYQIVVDQIEPLGAGALQLAFEQLKEKLAAEGLFDPKKKRALPAFPRKIAIITSPSGAAIRDMLNILARRAPHVEVLIIPSIVQGPEASGQIIKALQVANRHELGEVVIVTRGGGSIEDLWCFNDEALAREIATSSLPVISAVGHEIDFTISDFVADLRAPTPSAAAELVTASWVDVSQRIVEASARLRSTTLRDLNNRKTLLSHVAARLISPKDRLREQAQKCDELSLRLERATFNLLEKKKSRMEQLAGKLDALSPLKVLERGYALVSESSGENPSNTGIIRSVRQIRKDQELRIRFYDGSTKVQVKQVDE